MIENKTNKLLKENDFATDVRPYYNRIIEEEISYRNTKKWNNDNLMKQPFEIALEDVFLLINDFVKDLEVKNKDYAQKILDVLQGKNKNVIVKWCVNPFKVKTNPKGHVKRVNRGTNKEKTEVYIPIGKKKFKEKKIETSFHQIIDAVHLIAHSVSQRNRSAKLIPHKIEEAQEIESVFVEKLFINYLSVYKDVVADNMRFFGQKDINEKFIESMVREYFETKHDELLQNVSFVIYEYENLQEMKNKKDKRSVYKQVVGEVFARKLLKNFKSNPDYTMLSFALFVNRSCEIRSLNEMAEELFPDVLSQKINRRRQNKKLLSSYEIVLENVADDIKHETFAIKETNIIKK